MCGGKLGFYLCLIESADQKLVISHRDQVGELPLLVPRVVDFARVYELRGQLLLLGLMDQADLFDRGALEDLVVQQLACEVVQYVYSSALGTRKNYVLKVRILYGCWEVVEPYCS